MQNILKIATTNFETKLQNLVDLGLDHVAILDSGEHTTATIYINKNGVVLSHEGFYIEADFSLFSYNTEKHGYNLELDDDTLITIFLPEVL